MNVTDGRYVYMRACHDDTNQPLYEHTLMPTRIRGRFTPGELSGLTLAEPFGFTKGVRTLRIAANPSPLLGPQRFGSLLFDLETDPRQEKPLVDDTVELRMIRLLVERLRASEAPDDQYARLGVPHDPDEVGETHLLVAAQRERAENAREPAARSDEFPEGALNLRTPPAALLAEPAATEAIRRIVNRAAGHRTADRPRRRFPPPDRGLRRTPRARPAHGPGRGAGPALPEAAGHRRRPRHGAAPRAVVIRAVNSPYRTTK
ncbi:hypothetical protein [Streptomyces pratensis]|uniref:hypothetical protein n=1 Tax=Streptomyces pratensis TaxID=1169025 RepID=UPI003631DA25